MQSPVQLPAIKLDGHGRKIGIIVARYNWHITGTMLTLAHEELTRLGVEAAAIQVVSVPGSFELATAAQALLAGGDFDALICFGCIMKGATRHDVLVGDASAQGIQRVALDTGIPIIFGVVCAETEQQASERTIRGTECAQTAIEMAQIVHMARKS